jgi:hypothetical protein
MDLGTLANVVTASAAVIALVVGTGQLLHLRAERRERAAFEIVHATQTPEYIHSIMEEGRGLHESLPTGERLPEDMGVGPVARRATREKMWGARPDRGRPRDAPRMDSVR